MNFYLHLISNPIKFHGKLNGCRLGNVIYLIKREILGKEIFNYDGIAN